MDFYHIASFIVSLAACTALVSASHVDNAIFLSSAVFHENGPFANMKMNDPTLFLDSSALKSASQNPYGICFV